MSITTQHIPEVLIYEMVDGGPIYYRGYQDYILGTKQIEELMGSSYLQGVIVTELVILLSRLLDLTKYRIISNKIELRFAENSWRAADLTIFEKEKLKDTPLQNKYLEISPEVVIEIDTKAHLKDIENPLGYYQEKTDQLLEFGVQKVIWIFTDTRKVMIAERGQDWRIVNWNSEVEVIAGVRVNIEKIIRAAE